MKKISLRDREVAIALAELSGEVTIHRAMQHLLEKGLLPDPEDALLAVRLDFTRKAFQRSRKLENEAGSGRVEFLNFIGKNEDGTSFQYYRKIEECSIEEVVQDLEYCHNHSRYWGKELLRRYRIFAKIHGARKIQRRLTFAIPKAKDVAIA